MANKKEIRNHIESISDTKVITNAMYLIATSKMKKAKGELKNALPFFRFLSETMNELTSSVPHKEKKYFEEGKGYTALVVFSSDKGLSGGYNENIIRATCAFVKKEKNVKIFPVGETVATYVREHRMPAEENFCFGLNKDRKTLSETLSEYFFAMWKEGVRSIYLLYTDFSENRGKTVVKKLLPLQKTDTQKEYEYYPSRVETLEKTLPLYVEGRIYQAVLNAFASEQHARMAAMDVANKNAQKMLDELSVQYDRVRQNAITEEIIEVSCGAKHIVMQEKGGNLV